MTSSGFRIATVAALGLVTLGGPGCQLIASVDRDKIPQVTGAGGSTATSSATSSVTTGTGGGGGAGGAGVGGAGGMSTGTGTGTVTATVTATGTGTGGMGGMGSATASGTGGMGTGGTMGCTKATECPGQDNACEKRTCTGGVCGIDYTAAGMAIGVQVPGDCHVKQCDGAGFVNDVIDDGDVPADNNVCTNDVCSAGAPANVPLASGASCGGSLICNGFGGCVGCIMAADCPGMDTECQTRTCNGSTCGFNFTSAGFPTAAQVTGDCHLKQCNGMGGILDTVDNSDVVVDGDQCTSDLCTAGVPSNPPAPANTACNTGGGSVCNGMGACVQCIVASTCPGQNGPCKTKACTAGMCGFTFAALGTVVAMQTANDCKQNQCDGMGVVAAVPDDADVPVDSNACTSDVCTSGVPSNPSSPPGTSCNQGNGQVCNGGGVCVQCVVAGTCPGVDTACKTRTCQNNQCGFSFQPNGTVIAQQTPGDCQKNQCTGGNIVNVVDNADLPVDNNQCTDDVCTAGVPSNPFTPPGSPCSMGGVTCDGAGMCGP